LNVAPDRDFIKGEVFIIDTEFCEVTSHVAGSLSVFVNRGYAGSTAAVQSADVIQRSSAAAVATERGNIIVPLVDLTQADADLKISLAVPALRPEYGARLVGTNDVEFDVAFSDAHPANSEAMANATLANFAGGSDAFGVNKTVHLFKAVTSTAFVFVVPGTPVAAAAYVFDDSAGLVITGDTTTAISGREITVTEGAAPVWEDGVDNVLVEVYY